MPKTIAIFTDGTGNAASSLFKTNVWRLYQALDLALLTPQQVAAGTTPQIAYYQDGVGTSSFKPLAIIGGAFGWGLKRNVIDAYRYLCRNYQSNDRIFLFGFSRGGFTARILLGLSTETPNHICAGARRPGLAHATLEEQRAASRAETARAVAGLSSGSDSGINVALDAMTRTAQATRDRAAALDMKAKALSGAKSVEGDPNIAAAMATAAGTAANATVADRLAALQQRK